MPSGGEPQTSPPLFGSLTLSQPALGIATAVPSTSGGPWAFTRQAYRRSTQKLGVPDLNAMPLSAGVSEPSIYQHASTTYAQWASGSAAGGSTVHQHSHAGAYPAMAVNTPPASQPMASVHAEQPISKNKSPLPKLTKGGDPTTLTRLTNEWVQRTCEQVLPEKVTSTAMQKGTLTVPHLLFITFQNFLPSEPGARLDGLATVETPLKARSFSEALNTLRAWRQQIITGVTDLQALEPLKLFNSVRTLTSNLISADNSLVTEVFQMHRSTNIKSLCADQALLQLMGLLEIELSTRAQEDDERRGGGKAI